MYVTESSASFSFCCVLCGFVASVCNLALLFDVYKNSTIKFQMFLLTVARFSRVFEFCDHVTIAQSERRTKGMEP